MLTNDTDVDNGHVLTVAAVAGGNVGAPLTGTYGSVTINQNGSYSYTLDDSTGSAADHLAQGETATDVFNYTTTDEHGATSSSTLTINITGTNDAPVAVADTNTVTEAGVADGGNTPFVDTPTASGNVLTNDTDVDHGHVLTVAAVDGDANNVGATLTGTYGSVTINSDGTYSYTLDDSTGSAADHLAQGETASDVFNYTTTDEHGATSSSTLTINITGTNDAPVAVADSAAVTEAGVADGGNTPFVDTPTATGNVLNNDTDVDHGAVLTVAAVNGDINNVGTTVTGTYGSVTINSDGTYSYTLNDATGSPADHLAQGQTATDTFAYTTTDEHGATSSTTLTITITGTNDAPTMAPVAAGPLVDTSALDTFTTITGQLQGNDVDHNETASLTYAALDSSSHVVSGSIVGLYGELTVNSDGSYTYVPDAAAINALPAGSFADQFTVQATDIHGATGTTTFTVDVTGADDAPVAHDDANAITAGDAPVSGNLLANDTDAENDTLSVSAVDQAVAGSTTFTVDGTYGELVVTKATGAYTYTLGVTTAEAAAVAALGQGVTQQDQFTYTASDGTLGTDAHLTVDVTGGGGNSASDDWTGNAGDGEWSTAGNWDNGVPVATDNVFIDTDQSNPLTIALSDPTVTVADLTISSGIKLDIASGSNLIVNGVLTNAGHIDPLSLTLNGSLDNTGTIDNTVDDLTIGGAMTGDFVDPGTIEAATDLTISASVGGAFTINNGTIEADSGEVTISGSIDQSLTMSELGLILAGTDIVIAASGTQAISIGGSLTMSGSALIEAGTDVDISALITHDLSLSDTAQISADGGEVTISGSIGGNFSVTDAAFIEAGTLSGTGDVTINSSIGGDFSIIASDDAVNPAFIEAAGNIFIGSAITGSFSLGNGGFLEADGGDVQITGSIGGSFSLDASDTSVSNVSFIEASDNVLISAPITGGFSLAEGTYISADNGDLTIGAIGGDFANSGSLEASEGTITFNGLIGGSFTNAADGTITAQQLDIESAVGKAFENDGHITLGGSGSGISIGTSTIAVALTNTGTIDVQAGTLALSGGGSNDGGGTITIESGAELDIESNFSLTGHSTLEADGDVSVGAASAPVTLTLEGGATITASGGILALDDATDVLAITGAPAVGGGNPDATLDGVTVTNAGMIEVDPTASGAILALDDGTTITGGKLTIGQPGGHSGTLDIEAGSDNGLGATLDGVAVTDNGALDIGDAGSSAILTLDDGATVIGGGTGTLTINSNNTLDVEIGPNGQGGINGFSFDAALDGVTVTNSGTIDVDQQDTGELVLNLVDGTTITGGVLDIENSGEVYVQNGSGSFGATLDGVSVTNNGDGIDIGGPVTTGSTLILDDGTTITGGTR